jgi:hypothetical protein
LFFFFCAACGFAPAAMIAYFESTCEHEAASGLSTFHRAWQPP